MFSVSRSRRVTVFDDLEYLALNDPPDAIEIGPSSALNFVCVDRFSPKPEEDRDGGEHPKTDYRDQIVPIAK